MKPFPVYLSGKSQDEVSGKSERTLMSAVAWQPVSIASETDLVLIFNHTVLMC